MIANNNLYKRKKRLSLFASFIMLQPSSSFSLVPIPVISRTRKSTTFSKVHVTSPNNPDHKNNNNIFRPGGMEPPYEIYLSSGPDPEEEDPDDDFLANEFLETDPASELNILSNQLQNSIDEDPIVISSKREGDSPTTSQNSQRPKSAFPQSSKKEEAKNRIGITDKGTQESQPLRRPENKLPNKVDDGPKSVTQGKLDAETTKLPGHKTESSSAGKPQESSPSLSNAYNKQEQEKERKSNRKKVENPKSASPSSSSKSKQGNKVIAEPTKQSKSSDKLQESVVVSKARELKVERAEGVLEKIGKPKNTSPPKADKSKQGGNHGRRRKSSNKSKEEPLLSQSIANETRNKGNVVQSGDHSAIAKDHDHQKQMGEMNSAIVDSEEIQSSDILQEHWMSLSSTADLLEEDEEEESKGREKINRPKTNKAYPKDKNPKRGELDSAVLKQPTSVDRTDGPFPPFGVAPEEEHDSFNQPEEVDGRPTIAFPTVNQREQIDDWPAEQTKYSEAPQESLPFLTVTPVKQRMDSLNGPDKIDRFMHSQQDNKADEFRQEDFQRWQAPSSKAKEIRPEDPVNSQRWQQIDKFTEDPTRFQVHHQKPDSSFIDTSSQPDRLGTFLQDPRNSKASQADRSVRVPTNVQPDSQSPPTRSMKGHLNTPLQRFVRDPLHSDASQAERYQNDPGSFEIYQRRSQRNAKNQKSNAGDLQPDMLDRFMDTPSHADALQAQRYREDPTRFMLYKDTSPKGNHQVANTMDSQPDSLDRFMEDPANTDGSQADRFKEDPRFQHLHQQIDQYQREPGRFQVWQGRGRSGPESDTDEFSSKLDMTGKANQQQANTASTMDSQPDSLERFRVMEDPTNSEGSQADRFRDDPRFKHLHQQIDGYQKEPSRFQAWQRQDRSKLDTAGRATPNESVERRPKLDIINQLQGRDPNYQQWQQVNKFQEDPSKFQLWKRPSSASTGEVQDAVFSPVTPGQPGDWPLQRQDPNYQQRQQIERYQEDPSQFQLWKLPAHAQVEEQDPHTQTSPDDDGVEVQAVEAPFSNAPGHREQQRQVDRFNDDPNSFQQRQELDPAVLAGQADQDDRFIWDPAGRGWQSSSQGGVLTEESTAVPEMDRVKEVQKRDQGRPSQGVQGFESRRVERWRRGQDRKVGASQPDQSIGFIDNPYGSKPLPNARYMPPKDRLVQFRRHYPTTYEERDEASHVEDDDEDQGDFSVTQSKEKRPVLPRSSPEAGSISKVPFDLVDTTASKAEVIEQAEVLEPISNENDGDITMGEQSTTTILVETQSMLEQNDGEPTMLSNPAEANSKEVAKSREAKPKLPQTEQEKKDLDVETMRASVAFTGLNNEFKAQTEEVVTPTASNGKDLFAIAAALQSSKPPKESLEEAGLEQPRAGAKPGAQTLTDTANSKELRAKKQKTTPVSSLEDGDSMITTTTTTTVNEKIVEDEHVREPQTGVTASSSSEEEELLPPPDPNLKAKEIDLETTLGEEEQSEIASSKAALNEEEMNDYNDFEEEGESRTLSSSRTPEERLFEEASYDALMQLPFFASKGTMEESEQDVYDDDVSSLSAEGDHHWEPEFDDDNPDFEPEQCAQPTRRERWEEEEEEDHGPMMMGYMEGSQQWEEDEDMPEGYYDFFDYPWEITDPGGDLWATNEYFWADNLQGSSGGSTAGGLQEQEEREEREEREEEEVEDDASSQPLSRRDRRWEEMRRAEVPAQRQRKRRRYYPMTLGPLKPATKMGLDIPEEYIMDSATANTKGQEKEGL